MYKSRKTKRMQKTYETPNSQEVTNYISKASLLGDIVNIKSKSNGEIILLEYITKVAELKLPSFITSLKHTESVFKDSPNLKSIAMPNNDSLYAKFLLPETIEEVVLPEKISEIITLTPKKGTTIPLLKLIIQHSKFTIGNNAISSIEKLDIQDSANIFKIDYFGIFNVWLNEFTLRPWVSTPNCICWCNINNLNIWHGQSEKTFNNCTINKVIYHISQEHYDLMHGEKEIQEYFKNDLCAETTVNDFQVKIETNEEYERQTKWS